MSSVLKNKLHGSKRLQRTKAMHGLKLNIKDMGYIETIIEKHKKYRKLPAN